MKIASNGIHIDVTDQGSHRRTPVGVPHSRSRPPRLGKVRRPG
jgi:hypothetical protein